MRTAEGKRKVVSSENRDFREIDCTCRRYTARHVLARRLSAYAIKKEKKNHLGVNETPSENVLDENLVRRVIAPYPDLFHSVAYIYIIHMGRLSRETFHFQQSIFIRSLMIVGGFFTTRKKKLIRFI